MQALHRTVSRSTTLPVRAMLFPLLLDTEAVHSHLYARNRQAYTLSEASGGQQGGALKIIQCPVACAHAQRRQATRILPVMEKGPKNGGSSSLSFVCPECLLYLLLAVSNYGSGSHIGRRARYIYLRLAVGRPSGGIRTFFGVFGTPQFVQALFTVYFY